MRSQMLSASRAIGWAAAAGIPAGCIYLALCTLRGALQGIGDYRSLGLSLIGEQGVRLVAGGILAAAGLGIGGRVPRLADRL